MSSHVKAMLLPTSISILLLDASLVLGRWQGICVFGHRRRGSARQIVVPVG